MCRKDPNYFPAKRTQQIIKSAASKTSTLKEELKVLRCFSGRCFHKNFGPEKIKCSGIEKWLDQIYSEGKPKSTDHKQFWTEEGWVKHKSGELCLYSFKIIMPMAQILYLAKTDSFRYWWGNFRCNEHEQWETGEKRVRFVEHFPGFCK